jgi:hypothetical protein
MRARFCRCSAWALCDGDSKGPAGCSVLSTPRLRCGAGCDALPLAVYGAM